MVAAVEARQLGFGGVSAVSRACGLSRVTIHKGMRELDREPLPPDRIRRPGAGRPNVVDVFPDLPRYNSVQARHLEHWAKAAGITKRMHFHVARHTFAMLLLSGGVDLFAVSGLLGHSNIATTQIYAKLTDTAKQSAIDKLPTI